MNVPTTEAAAMNLPPTEAQANARYLVLSDMHFGTPESSVNTNAYLSALVSHIVSRAPWEEIVLTGDILDANLSTFRKALEGDPRSTPPLVGFRNFVAAVHAANRSAGGLAGVAKRWVYAPGNHDYKVWDAMASQVMFEDVVDAGLPLTSVHPPLISRAWPKGMSFFAGIFTPFGVRDRVWVEYPNHVLSFGELGMMVLTHGHYLDPSQTRFHDLLKNLGGLDGGALKSAVRDLVIETAQYQAIANAVSFRADTTRFVNGLVGPDSWPNKVKNWLTRLASRLAVALLLKKGRLRDEPLSEGMLQTIAVYLEKFCGYTPPPRWFVFGHTHRQGAATLVSPPISVFNVGSCYVDSGHPITFLEIETDASVTPTVTLKHVDARGTVCP